MKHINYYQRHQSGNSSWIHSSGPGGHGSSGSLSDSSSDSSRDDGSESSGRSDRSGPGTGSSNVPGSRGEFYTPRFEGQTVNRLFESVSHADMDEFTVQSVIGDISRFLTNWYGGQ